MFNHSDIWRAIDLLAEAKGYSASGLAKQAGLDPTTFNKSKRTSADGKPRWPSTESLSKILSVTGTSLHQFFCFIDENAKSSPASFGKGDRIAVHIDNGHTLTGAFEKQDEESLILTLDGEIQNAQQVPLHNIEWCALIIPHKGNSKN